MRVDPVLPLFAARVHLRGFPPAAQALATGVAVPRRAHRCVPSGPRRIATDVTASGGRLGWFDSGEAHHITFAQSTTCGEERRHHAQESNQLQRWFAAARLSVHVCAAIDDVLGYM
jgi:hypothetical protein